MKFGRLVPSLIALAMVCLAGASSAHAASKYRIITEGDLGFKRGNTFFSLKMAGVDFETRFGPADKRTRLSEGQRLAYLNEGIAVVIANGSIRSITFVIAPDKTERYLEYQPASAVTSGGINRSSTIDDVIKSEGQPTDRSEDAALGATTLRYAHGGIEYSFRFKDGVLSQIVLTGPRA